MPAVSLLADAHELELLFEAVYIYKEAASEFQIRIQPRNNGFYNNISNKLKPWLYIKVMFVHLFLIGEPNK